MNYETLVMMQNCAIIRISNDFITEHFLSCTPELKYIVELKETSEGIKINDCCASVAEKLC